MVHQNPQCLHHTGTVHHKCLQKNISIPFCHKTTVFKPSLMIKLQSYEFSTLTRHTQIDGKFNIQYLAFKIIGINGNDSRHFKQLIHYMYSKAISTNKTSRRETILRINNIYQNIAFWFKLMWV